MAIGKPGGLGVLDDWETLESRLRGIRNALHQADRERGIKDALNILKDLKTRVNTSKKDGRKLRKHTNDVIARVTAILPFIEGKKAGKKRRGKEK